MARKITTKYVGDPLLGQLRVNNNTITTLGTNANLTIDPNGSGQTNVVGNLQVTNASSLQLADSDNSNYISIKCPSTLASNYTLTFPADDGTSSQYLTTDGSGNLSWTSVSFSITDDTTTNSSGYYPLLSTSSSGSITGFYVSSTKLKFNPAAGSVYSSIIVGNDNVASGNLYLRSTTNGAKGQVYIDEGTASSSTSTGALRVAGGVGIAGSCYVGGTVSAASIIETSSIAYKENVNPIENGLDTIMKLVGVTYDRKDGTTKNEPGLIAEEVYKVLPNLVSTKEGKPDSLSYTKLTAYLIEAVKTLKKEIEALKGNIK